MASNRVAFVVVVIAALFLVVSAGDHRTKDGPTCEEAPKSQRERCHKLMDDIRAEMKKIANLSDPPTQIPEEGSTLQRVVVLCRNVGTFAQETACRKGREFFAPRVQAVMENDKDYGFCRINYPSKMPQCWEIMKTVIHTITAISEMTRPATPIPRMEDSPVALAGRFCKDLQGDQASACDAAKEKIRGALTELTAPPPKKKETPRQEAPKPAPRTICDEVPRSKKEECRRFVVDMKSQVRALAEKASKPAPADGPVLGMIDALCSTISARVDLQACGELVTVMVNKRNALFGMSATGATGAAPTGATGSATGATGGARTGGTGATGGASGASGPASVDESTIEVKPTDKKNRAKVCKNLGSRELAAQCDETVARLREGIIQLVVKNRIDMRQLTPPTPTDTVLNKARSVCRQLPPALKAPCTDKINRASAKITLIRSAAKPVAVSTGCTGATGAKGATGGKAATAATGSTGAAASDDDDGPVETESPSAAL